MVEPTQLKNMLVKLDHFPRVRGKNPVSKWLGSPPFISHLGHLEGEQPYLRDLLTAVIGHRLAGMILQVGYP